MRKSLLSLILAVFALGLFPRAAAARDELAAFREQALAARARPREALGHARDAARWAERLPSWSRPGAHRFCARLWLELKDYPKAITSLKRALALNPDDLDALELLTGIMKSRPGEPAARDDEDAPGARVPDARVWTEETLGAALSADPDDLDALRRLIDLRLQGNRREEAITLAGRFSDAAGRAPAWQGADAEREAARVWHALGDEARVRESVARARELEPRALEPFAVPGSADAAATADAYAAIAAARAALKDDEGAANGLKRALELAADPPRRYAILSALIGLELGRRRPAEALSLAERLIAESGSAPAPRRAELQRRAAGIRLELKDAAGAEKNYADALALAPGDAETLADLVRFEDGRGRPAAALSYADRELEALTNETPSRRAEAAREKARLQLQLGDREGGAASLGQALALAPGDASSAQKLIALDMGLGRPREALAAAELALGAAEKNSRARAELERREAEIRRALARGSGGEEDLSPERALAAVERALAAAKDAPPPRRAADERRKAQLQLALKDPDGAAASLNRALALVPGERESLAMLVRLESARGRIREALAYADRLVASAAAAPAAERAAAHRLRAGLRYELDDEAGAREDFARALEDAPRDPELLGAAAALRGDYAGAAAADAGICLGELFQARRDRLAPAFFDRCLEKFPENPALYSDRGVARYGRGDADGAIADFSKALALKPDFREARLNLAAVLAARGAKDK